MRPEVRTFTAGGPLPDQDADEEEIARRVGQLDAVSAPVTPTRHGPSRPASARTAATASPGRCCT
ncbi:MULTISPECIES: hypothetical protein [unclassified Streptomyces]|uniref:hypothetical protein n=1 Tax=unclassified Streptomyces TaxID=2593676 RepID=UPI0033A59535